VAEALNRLVDEFAATLAKVHALVDRMAAETGAARGTVEAPLGALIAELDRTMDFFRLEPRRTIREGDC